MDHPKCLAAVQAKANALDALCAQTPATAEGLAYLMDVSWELTGSELSVAELTDEDIDGLEDHNEMVIARSYKALMQINAASLT